MELSLRCEVCKQLVVTMLLLWRAAVMAAHEGPGPNASDPAAGLVMTAAGDSSHAVAKLLLMLPLDNTSSETEIWDRGQEILPAARMAVQQINAHPHLLQDSTLELLEVDIKPCIVDQFAANIHALVPFASISSDSRSDVLGMVGGPFCPPLLTRLVSPLASREESRLFQMSGSTAGTVRKQNQSIHFITPSVELYYETVYAMMHTFNWSRIYVMAESFFQGVRSVEGSSDLNITFRQFYSSSSALFRDLRVSEKNIVFASLSPQHAGDVLCQAHKEGLLYPDYVWIFADLTPDLILEGNRGRCDRDTLRSALSGTFFLRFPFAPKSRDTRLVSGDLYSDYSSRLVDVPENPYANVVYDAIWAVGLALNLSLATSGQPLSHHFNSRERKQDLIELMDTILPEVSFQGASGKINFSESERTVNDAVDIYLYSNGTSRRVGFYQTSAELSIDGGIMADVPGATPPHVYILVPIWLTGVLATSVTMCIVLTSAVLALFIYYREDSDIKATSPYLSYLMFFGCYLLLISSLVHTIRGSLVVSGVGVEMVCGAVITGDSLGVNLIFTTLLLRMLRVYRIFNHFGKTGKLWSNRNMACIVGLVVLGDVVLILVWSCVDTYRIMDVVIFRSQASPPRYEVQQFCHSEHSSLWLAILLGKLGVLFVLVLFLAIKTRKICRSNFKDTKKVNMYIFSTVIIVITFMTLFFLFVETENSLAAHLMVYLAFGVTALLCQVFLFVPKVTSPLLKKYGYEVNYNRTTRRNKLQKRIPRTSMTILIASASNLARV